MPIQSDPNAVDQREVLALIKSLVAIGDYHFSNKVLGYLEDGCYGLEDLEAGIMTARSIRKIEVDELQMAVDGYKYTIIGRDSEGYEFYTCGKIIESKMDHKMYFFITAHGTD